MTDSDQPTLDVLKRIRTLVAEAKAVPMSASCMVNRAQLLALIDDATRVLPKDLTDSRAVIAERYTSNAAVREQAEQILANARAEARELASMSAVARLADEQAETVRDQAAQDAIALRVEADRYIDARLAAFEAELQKTQGQLKTMRTRLAARSHLDESDVEALPDI
jgi:hypothetical protein